VAPLMMATASVPLLAGLGAVSQGVMTRHFEFRMLAIRRTIGISVAGLACVVLAWMGYGAWSLVIQAILTPAVMSAVALLAGPVRVIEPFTGSEVRRVVRQSGLLCGSTALIQGNTRLSDLVVGYFAGPAGAGAFRLARTVVDLILSVTFTPLSNVLLPIFAKANENPERTLSMYVKIVVSCSLIFFGGGDLHDLRRGSLPHGVYGRELAGAGLGPDPAGAAVSDHGHFSLAAFADRTRAFGRGALGEFCPAGCQHRLSGHRQQAGRGEWCGGGYTVCTYLALVSMLLFMRREIPELRAVLTLRVLVPQLLALAIGLGGYLLALRLGLHPANIVQAVAALIVVLAIFAGCCLILCRQELDVAIDVLPVPGGLKNKIRNVLRIFPKGLAHEL
jgi:hypothetical protein